MKGWLARAVANTVVRGEDRRNRFARWSRWFAPAAAVEASAFQDEDDLFPRHWREFPSPWPVDETEDPAVAAELLDALRELPDTWRGVVLDRDVRRRDPQEVAARHGVTLAEQRAILNQARATLRERLARTINREGEAR